MIPRKNNDIVLRHRAAVLKKKRIESKRYDKLPWSVGICKKYRYIIKM